MAAVSVGLAGEATGVGQEPLLLAMQHMAQALNEMQAAVRLQNKRKHEAVVQDQKMQEMMAQTQAAIGALTDRVRRMEDRVGAFERGGGKVAREQQPLEQLDSRVSSLEATAQRMQESFFPRVEALVVQQETSTPPGAPSSSTAASTAPAASSSNRSNVSPMEISPRPSALTTKCSFTRPFPSSFKFKRPKPSAARTSTPSDSSSNPGSSSHQASTSTGAEAHVRSEIRQQYIEDLWNAVEKGSVVDVQKLLDKGVDVNCRFGLGLTPLMSAAACAHAHMLEILLGRGADAELTTIDDNTALHFAAIKDASGSCVQALVRGGADVGSKDVNGNTPLHRAVGRGNEAAVRALREGRANPTARNDAGFTPLDLAQNPTMRRLLL